MKTVTQIIQDQQRNEEAQSRNSVKRFVSVKSLGVYSLIWFLSGLIGTGLGWISVETAAEGTYWSLFTCLILSVVFSEKH
jgi:hypothetical protein